jgi:hypothetical protein
MVATVTPSGKAPPGRLRSGVGAIALVTADPVRPTPRSKEDAAWVDTWACLVTTKGRTKASRRRMPYGYHTTQTPEERLT